MTALLLVTALVCGRERWDVKTLHDENAWSVKKTIDGARGRTMGVLTRTPPPDYWGNNLPRLPEELSVEEVSGFIVGYKLEADGDYHVVIQGDGDDDEITMVVEFPAPACIHGSRWEVQMIRARAQLRELLPALPTPKMRWLTTTIPITLAGVVFFDKVHGQAGVAPNGVELHPVLWILRRHEP